MNVVLIAHNDKNELMSQFCEAQRQVLSQHALFATAFTANWVEKATGLQVKEFMNSEQGGYQQIAAYVAWGEVDLVVFFRNSPPSDAVDSDEVYLLYMCDKCGVPVATNIATAELLVRAMQNDIQGWETVLNHIHQ